MHEWFTYSIRSASDLIHIWVPPCVSEDIKSGVQVVEQVDNFDSSLSRGMLAAESVESHDAAEEDGDVVVALGRHRSLVTQLISHWWRQHRIQQSAEGNGTKLLMK